MDMTVTPAGLDGAVVIVPDIFSDDRGYFYESYSARRFHQHGIDLEFIQDNHSRSRAGVIRGLHYQGPAGAQWRLVRCTIGEIFDVIVDLRVGSPTFGKWIGVHLSAENKHQLLIPPPFAHGFAVLSGVAEVQYKCTGLHNPSAERALSYADPQLAIEWSVSGSPIVSAKDAAAPSFADYLANPDFPQNWEQSVPHIEESA